MKKKFKVKSILSKGMQNVKSFATVCFESVNVFLNKIGPKIKRVSNKLGSKAYNTWINDIVTTPTSIMDAGIKAWNIAKSPLGIGVVVASVLLAQQWAIGGVIAVALKAFINVAINAWLGKSIHYIFENWDAITSFVVDKADVVADKITAFKERHSKE